MHSIVLVVINREEGFYGCRRFKTENKNSEHEFPEGMYTRDYPDSYGPVLVCSRCRRPCSFGRVYYDGDGSKKRHLLTWIRAASNFIIRF